MTSEKKYQPEYLINPRQAVLDADRVIKEERSGEQIGLKSRWTKVNQCMLKYFRYKQNTIIGGLSGSGKSYIKNMLAYDFLDVQDMEFGSIDDFVYIGDPKYAQEIGDDLVYADSRLGVKSDGTVYRKALNVNAKYKPVLIHFSPEMPPADEYIRTASNILGCSFAYLLSAQHDGTTYNQLSDSEYKTFRRIMNILQDGRMEYHYTIPPTLEELVAIVDEVANLHDDKVPVVTIDHTLLMKRLGASEPEFLYQLAVAAIEIRETYGAMVILLHQLNDKIKGIERKSAPANHYPVDGDLYWGNQIWWAADNVFIGHQPRKLGIGEYGIEKLKTDNLYHLACLKSRRGEPGNIWMKQDLAHGRIFEVGRNEFSPKK